MSWLEALGGVREGAVCEWVVFSFEPKNLQLIQCYAEGITYDNTKLGADPYTVRNSAFFTLHEYEKNQPL